MLWWLRDLCLSVLNSHITKQSPIKVWNDYLVLLWWQGPQYHSWAVFMRWHVLNTSKRQNHCVFFGKPRKKKLSWPTWGTREDLRMTHRDDTPHPNNQHSHSKRPLGIKSLFPMMKVGVWFFTLEIYRRGQTEKSNMHSICTRLDSTLPHLPS